MTAGAVHTLWNKAVSSSMYISLVQ